MEDIFYLLRIPQRKPYGSMENDVKKAIKVMIMDFLFPVVIITFKLFACWVHCWVLNYVVEAVAAWFLVCV